MKTKVYKELSKKANTLSLSSKTRSDEFYKKYILTSKEEVSLVLKSHLYLEKVIDEILTLTLPESKKIIKMSFLDKVTIVESMDFFIPNKVIIEKIKAINTIRNKFSHELDYTLKRDDLNKLFKVHKNTKDSNLALFMKEIGYLRGYLEAKINVNKLFPFLMSTMRNKNLFKDDKNFHLKDILISHEKAGLLDIIKELKM